MIGLLYFEQGQFERATSAYLSGLETAGNTADQEASLYFDLGTAYERAQQGDEALRYFREAARVVPNYRNVDQKVRALESRLAG